MLGQVAHRHYDDVVDLPVEVAQHGGGLLHLPDTGVGVWLHERLHMEDVSLVPHPRAGRDLAQQTALVTRVA